MKALNDLYDLIGIEGFIEIDEAPVKCRIICVYIDDWNFYEHGECINIRINVEPIGDISEDDIECCSGLYLREFYNTDYNFINVKNILTI